MILRVDQDGPTVSVRTGEPPETLLVASPDVVVGLAAGAIGIEQAVAAGDFRGDPRVLHAVFDRD
jgi:hypothetical protein